MAELIVRRVASLTERISEFELGAAEGALPDWTPGAHVDVATHAGVRSYSLIRWPGDRFDGWRIAVQREPEGAGGSVAMHGLGAGDRVSVEGPANDFELVDSDRPVALIAGGIGVTPLVSMATALAAAGRKFVMHYAGRSEGVMAYLSDLRGAFGDRLVVHPDDRAPIDLGLAVGGMADHDLYICGPRGMIEATRAAATAAGIPDDRVRVELFAAPVAEAGDTAFEVELASTGDVYAVPPGQTIIEVLEAAGHDLVYDCQRGDCGICQTDVLDGVPDHRDVVLSDSERESGKVMQICVSRAKSPRLVLDL
ncbi:MAG: PDR/VanB family oxidoreductase [Pseudomonadota bacterium]